MEKEKMNVITLAEIYSLFSKFITDTLMQEGRFNLDNYIKETANQKKELLNSIFESEVETIDKIFNNSSIPKNKVVLEIFQATKTRLDEIVLEADALTQQLKSGVKNYEFYLLCIIRAKYTLIDKVFDVLLRALDFLFENNRVSMEEITGSKTFEQICIIHDASRLEYWNEYIQFIEIADEDFINTELKVFPLLLEDETDSKKEELINLFPSLREKVVESEHYGEELIKECQSLINHLNILNHNNDLLIGNYQKRHLELTSKEENEKLIKELNIPDNQKLPNTYMDHYNLYNELIVKRIIEDNDKSVNQAHTIALESLKDKKLSQQINDLIVTKINYINHCRSKQENLEDAKINLDDLKDKEKYDAYIALAISLLKAEGAFDDVSFEKYLNAFNKALEVKFNKEVTLSSKASLEEVEERLKTLYKRKNENSLHFTKLNVWLMNFKVKLKGVLKSLEAIDKFIEILDVEIKKTSK